MRIFAAISAVLLLISGATGASAQQRFQQEPTLEGLRVCNKTPWPIELARAINTGEKNANGPIIVSSGWYQLEVGQCIIAFGGPLEGRYYLLYGQAKQVNKEWGGDIPICVSREPFNIRSNLCGPEYYRRMFFEVDTGGDTPGFTQNLTP